MSFFSLPYTEATLRETMRKDTFVPLGIVHRTIEDTKFRGYDIPKVTFIGNVYMYIISLRKLSI